MSKWYWIVLAIIIAIPVAMPFVVKWLVAPILLRFKQKIPARVRFEHVGPEILTPEARQSLNVIVPQFLAEGFENRGMLAAKGDELPGSGAQVLFAHPSTGDLATVFATWSTGIRALTMAVKSEFRDGTVIETGATKFIGYHPPHPGVDYVCFSWVKDAHSLCEAHRRRVERRGKSADPRVPLAPGDEARYLERDSDAENERMVRLGYHYFDQSANTCRLTWKGAFLSAWRLSEPLRTRRRNRRDRSARIQWRELGMEQWQPPIISPPTPPPLPPLVVTSAIPAPVAPPDLGYEIALPEGQFRREVIEGGITVYAGNPTAGQYLARHWWSLAFIGFALTMFAILGVVWWRQYLMSLRAPGVRRGVPVTPLAFVGAIATFDAIKLMLGLRRLGTPTSVSATEAGLTFQNVPALRRSGHIPREDLNGLHVVIEQFGFIAKRRYQLMAIVTGGRARKLFVSPDKETLESVKKDLLAAMGIELPEQATDSPDQKSASSTIR